MSNVIFMLSFIVNDTFKSLALLRLLFFFFWMKHFLLSYYLLFLNIIYYFLELIFAFFGICQAFCKPYEK